MFGEPACPQRVRQVVGFGSGAIRVLDVADPSKALPPVLAHIQLHTARRGFGSDTARLEDYFLHIL